MSEIPASPALPPAKGNPCLFKIVIAAVVTLLVLGGLWWWFNRPIKPVVLTPQEKSAVEAKVEAIQNPEPTYEKGTKEIILTERELNGLLNEQTDLGKTVSLQLGTNVVLARIETDLDPDLPVVGGKRLKARARFLVSQKPGQVSLILDDLTVWGVSLPNEWLGNFKGRDLLSETLGNGTTGKIPGIEELKVEPGKLIIRLAE